MTLIHFILSFLADKSIAFVVLGNGMVSKGSGITHWNAMLENPELTIAECHELQAI